MRACWCRDCQYLASGNASISAIVPTAGFTLTGEVRTYVSTADSGNTIRRRFCPACATPLFATTDDEPNFMALRVGTLDNPSATPPTSVIWAESAPCWAARPTG